MPKITVDLTTGFEYDGQIRHSRVVHRDDGGTENHCALCDTTLTWFTFENVWRGGQVVARVCSAGCQCTEFEKEEDDD